MGGDEALSDLSIAGPVWDVVERYLKDIKTIKPRAPNLPRIIGMSGNQGLA